MNGVRLGALHDPVGLAGEGCDLQRGFVNLQTIVRHGGLGRIEHTPVVLSDHRPLGATKHTHLRLSQYLFDRRSSVRGALLSEGGVAKNDVREGPADQPDVIQRVCEREYTVHRDAAISRLPPVHSAEGGGQPARAARVGAERQRDELGRDGGGRPPLDPPGIGSRPRGCGSLRVGCAES